MRQDYSYTQKLAGEVVEYVSNRSIVGTTFDLAPYVSQPVNINATLYVYKDYDATELVANIKAYLEGVTFNYESVVFDDTLVKSDIEAEIKETFSGVLSFRITSPTEDIIKPVAPQNILTMGTVNITVSGL